MFLIEYLSTKWPHIGAKTPPAIIKIERVLEIKNLPALNSS